MAEKTSDWRPGPSVCRCCLTEGCYKDISTEYFWMGKREVYEEMLTETLSVSIAFSQSGGPNSNSRLICEPCISRLRDATDFRRQVLECERTFMQHLDPASADLDVDESAEVVESSVKLERVKQEARLSEEDFDDRCEYLEDDDDGDDDLDEVPLTKLASRVPKKESVDLLDLLDNSKVAAKRKSTAKTKASPAKKVKVIKEQKPSSSKAVKPEKKKKDNKRSSETSNWQMTVAERKNAAMFIQYTTVRPFIYMGSTFKCFFCLKYYSELHLLLDHTSTHVLPDDEEAVMSQYIPKGKRTIQVDTSNLKCRICDDSFPTLDNIKQHLKCVHEKVFSLASNGMTEYKMNAQDGFIVCHICNDKFVSFSQINTHMNVHVGKVVCETCGKGFLNQHMLKKHRETHFLKKFDCPECNQVFLKKTKLKYHMDFVHRGKDRVKMKKCPECSETFKEYYSKMVHLKVVHGIAKTFPCTICRKPFGTRRALTEHTTRVHTERFKCEVCSQCFSIKSRLKLHMRTHSGEKNFICPICQNAYMHEMTLKKHLKSHSLEFKFNCKNCGVGFQGRGDFLKHRTQCHMSRGRPETIVS